MMTAIATSSSKNQIKVLITILFVIVCSFAIWPWTVPQEELEKKCETKKGSNATFYAKQPDSLFFISKQDEDYRSSKKHTEAAFLRRFIGNLIKGANPKFISCNAPKTGCTAYNYFYLYINEGVSWNATQIRNHPFTIYEYWMKQINEKTKPENFGNYSDEEVIQMDQTLDRIVVARNPYVRFLSSYLDWLSRSSFTQETVPFANFTDIFAQNKLLKLSSKGPLNHIETVSKYCHVGEKDYVVLRVEEQALWFDEFLRKYGLQEKMDNYTRSTGNVVFASGLKAGDLIQDHAASIAGKEAWPTKLFESSHHRGSASKLAQYYTPALARQVTQLQMADFVNFGYPLWDGNPNNFRLV